MKVGQTQETTILGFPGGSGVKNPPAQEPQELQVRSLGQGDLLEKEMATHSSVLAWRIPWTGAWWASPWGQKELDVT